MRILFLLYRYPGIGGIENITTLLANSFKHDLGNEVAIFSVINQQGINVKLDDITIITVGTNSVNTISYEFKKCLEDFQPDVIIFQDSYAEIEYLFQNIGKDTRLYIVEHNTPDSLLKAYVEYARQHRWCKLGGLLRKLLFPIIYTKIWLHQRSRHKLLVGASDKYILLSPSYKSILQNFYRIKCNNLMAIPNIKNDFGALGCEYMDKEKVVLFVGRLSHQKGLDKLMAVWYKIEQCRRDYRLVIIGDGEQKELVLHYIKKYHLQNVKCEGFKQNVDEYYKKASALFMTSIFEGLPLVLAEAMQFGVVPFVYDTFSSVHDIIIDSINGYIVRPFDKEGFVRAFLSFSALDDESVNEMRYSAIHSSQKFSKGPVLEQWSYILK